MVEACFVCLDSTEYMRNGDQYPTRMMAEQDAACLLVNAKLQANAENTLGFLTTGGNACVVHETLTNNVDAVMTSIGNVSITGKRCNFSSGLQIAALALSHRTNSRAEKRIVAFVGSPVLESEADLEALAKKLRKDDVAVDIVAFGVESNVELLRAFVNKVSKKENSRFLSVEPRENLTDKLMGNAILLGENAPEGGDGGGGMGGFGVDPNTDPELAMALRLSMEDEMQRQAAAAAAAAGGAATEASATATTSPSAAAATTTQGTSTAAPAPAAAQDDNEPDYENMSEEELIRRAIALSLQDAAPQPESSAGGGDNTGGAPAQAQGEAHKNEEEEEDDFAKGVEDALKKEEDKKNEE